jgi:hypothetical protein
MECSATEPRTVNVTRRQPYNVKELAQSNAAVSLSALRFIRDLCCPVNVHMFGFDEGWAASHCHIGGLAPMQAVIFDWLDKAVCDESVQPKINRGNPRHPMFQIDDGTTFSSDQRTSVL